MRLSEEERTAIVEGIEDFISDGTSAELLLFGSRVDESLRGGDIDLAIIIHEQTKAEELKKIDYKILAKLKTHKSIGDRKIDLKILTIGDRKKVFYQIALKSALVLKKWSRK